MIFLSILSGEKVNRLIQSKKKKRGVAQREKKSGSISTQKQKDTDHDAVCLLMYSDRVSLIE